MERNEGMEAGNGIRMPVVQGNGSSNAFRVPAEVEEGGPMKGVVIAACIVIFVMFGYMAYRFYKIFRRERRLRADIQRMEEGMASQAHSSPAHVSFIEARSADSYIHTTHQKPLPVVIINVSADDESISPNSSLQIGWEVSLDTDSSIEIDTKLLPENDTG